jgi:hypothetical protein
MPVETSFWGVSWTAARVFLVGLPQEHFVDLYVQQAGVPKDDISDILTTTHCLFFFLLLRDTFSFSLSFP